MSNTTGKRVLVSVETEIEVSEVLSDEGAILAAKRIVRDRLNNLIIPSAKDTFSVIDAELVE